MTFFHGDVISAVNVDYCAKSFYSIFFNKQESKQARKQASKQASYHVLQKRMQEVMRCNPTIYEKKNEDEQGVRSSCFYKKKY
jgi:hypothetical protein